MGAPSDSVSLAEGPDPSHADAHGLDPAQRLREVEATGHMGSWGWDIATNVVTWSDELYRIYGHEPQSVPVTYESFLQRLHPDDRQHVAATIERSVQTGERFIFTHRIICPDGTVRWHQGRGQAIMAGSRAVRMFGIAQDVTGRVESEQALRQSLDQAHRLAAENERLSAELEAQLLEVRASRARIVEAGDEARRRLERDLHDGAQQQLTTLGLMLRTAELKLPATAEPELSQILRAAGGQLEAALSELRALARGLHPTILTDEGLLPALQALVARSPLPVGLRASEIARLPAAIEAAAYFVASEALTNVVKHAGASKATVSVQHRDDRLLVEVGDDGGGGATLQSGGGLRGLADRLAALDGRLDLHSQADQGTRLRAQLPCA
jgi:PAS domain S-box-containing protein